MISKQQAQFNKLTDFLSAVNTGEYEKALEEAERYIYMSAFHSTKYNQSKAAIALGVSRGTFRTKLNKFWNQDK